MKLHTITETTLPQQFDPKQIKPVQWHMPNIMEERGEIARQAQAIGIDRHQLIQAIKQARLTPLDDQTWARMQNTNSNDPNLNMQELTSWTHRDIGRILKAFQTGGALPAPIVLVHKGTPTCLAGNTRLSVCKVLGIRPQVLMVQS